MRVSVQSENPPHSYSLELNIPERAKRWLTLAALAALAALFISVVRPLDPQALASAQEAPILQGD